FIYFKNSAEGWAAFDENPNNTGCAHFVAHHLGITTHDKKMDVCDLGYTIKVPLLTRFMEKVEPKDVQVDDIWVNADKSHYGYVEAVVAADKKGTTHKITIRQCSSNVKANRIGPNSQDWATFFHKGGSFYRP